jgi:hypothetical protein
MAKLPEYAFIKDKTGPRREIMAPDGTVRVEKLSPIRYHFWAIDPDGNRVSIPLATGRNFPIGVDQNNQVAVVMKLRKRPPKFLPVTECPVRKGYLKIEGDRGCDGDDGQGNFGKIDGANGFRTGDNTVCCDHLKAIAKARKAAKAKKVAASNKRFEMHQDKVVNELRAATEALRDKVDHVRRKDVKSDNASAGFSRKSADAE